MDSFVLSETFKYLYMIFAEPGDLPFDPDNYVMTTEAHFLPLSIGAQSDDVTFSFLMDLLQFSFYFIFFYLRRSQLHA